MLIFYGDCNSAAIANAKFFSEHGVKTESRFLPTPANFAKNTFKCPIELWSKIKEFKLEKFLNPATFEYQFSPFSASSNPEMFIITVGHEYRPIYYNETDGYYFWIDGRAFDDNMDFKNWFFTAHKSAFLDSAEYAKRIVDMAEGLTHLFPNTPTVIVSKISPAHFFGPFLYTHFQNWGTNYGHTITFIRDGIKRLKNTHLLEMDRIVTGLISRNKMSKEGLIPNIMYMNSGVHPALVNSFGGNYLYMRDLDHLHPSVYEECAGKIYEIGSKGRICYDDSEVSLIEFDYKTIEKLNASTCDIQNMLNSNDVSLFNNALESLINKDDDCSNMVLQALTSGNIKFDQYITQGLKVYLSIKKCTYAMPIINALTDLLSQESGKINSLDYENLMFEILDLKRIVEELWSVDTCVEYEFLKSAESEDFLLSIRKSKKIGIYGTGHYGILLGKYIGGMAEIVFFDDACGDGGKVKSVSIDQYFDALDMLIVTPSNDEIALRMLSKAANVNSRILARIPINIYRVLDSKYGSILMDDNFHFICNKCASKQKQGIANVVYIERFMVIGTKCQMCGHEVELNFDTCTAVNEL